jgi:hypothetical protein
MNLNCKVAWLKKVKEAGGADLTEDYRWHDNERFVEVDIENFSDDDLTVLLDIVRGNKDHGSRPVVQTINMFRKLRSDPTGTKISNLQGLEKALREYIGKSEHKWVFKENSDGHVVPWYVKSIQYQPYDQRKHNDCAYTQMTLVACRNGSRVEEAVRWETPDLGETVVNLLHGKNYYVETPGAVEAYSKEMQHYLAVQGRTGEQFLVTGRAYEKNDWGYYRFGLTAMERDGVASRVVMDDMFTDEGEPKTVAQVIAPAAYWLDNKASDEQEEKVVIVPVQPYVEVYDLERHGPLFVHTANLKPYQYCPELIHKLILPAERKDLISILIAGADLQMEDIVGGKTGGIIVICTGPPGTGKTLSAEVFSESMKRPLYCVQCSQLGIDEATLENKLKQVLNRAMRWKAILLVDEADVYIHERGEDIKQNSIVGIWLRVLEHFRGIMFLTSNRETIIDDAIMSRATAWIQYDYPESSAAAEIWRVLSENYKVDLTTEDIVELGKLFPKISGRSIKNLLRLAALLASKTSVKVNVKLLKYVSQFIDLGAP